MSMVHFINQSINYLQYQTQIKLITLIAWTKSCYRGYIERKRGQQHLSAQVACSNRCKLGPKNLWSHILSLFCLFDLGFRLLHTYMEFCTVIPNAPKAGEKRGQQHLLAQVAHSLLKLMHNGLKNGAFSLIKLFVPFK